jgi:hypothetical protein
MVILKHSGLIFTEDKLTRATEFFYVICNIWILQLNFWIVTETTNIKAIKWQSLNDTFTFIVGLHSLIGWDNIFKYLSNITFSINLLLLIVINFLFVNVAKFYINIIKLSEVKEVESQIAQMKSNEKANEEMNCMFQSLEEAIVLVDKKKIAFQNLEYESMIEQLLQLSSQGEEKGDSLDCKLFSIYEDNMSSSTYNSNQKNSN